MPDNEKISKELLVSLHESAKMLRGRNKLDITHQEEQNKTLAEALVRDHRELIQLSSALGADDPLHKAVKLNKIDSFTAILEAGVDVNAKDKDGNTALHYAALTGNKKAVTALIKNGADPAIENVRGETSLHLAQENKDAVVIQALLPSKITQALTVVKSILGGGSNLTVPNRRASKVIEK